MLREASNAVNFAPFFSTFREPLKLSAPSAKNLRNHDCKWVWGCYEFPRYG